MTESEQMPGTVLVRVPAATWRAARTAALDPPPEPLTDPTA